MKTILALSTEIGDWSQANFGNTPVPGLTVITHTDEITPNQPMQGALVELNWMAPLLGMGEEIGEFAKQTDGRVFFNDAESIDSIADAGIYFCDYLCRRGMEYENFEFVKLPIKEPTVMLAEAYGALLHVELKRAQMIRGMDAIEQFKSAHRQACGNLYYTLQFVCNAFTGMKLEALIDEVFQAVVSKRNFKKNKATG